MRLGEFYARRLAASGLAFDMLFGPAYKGITLAAAVARRFGRRGARVPSRTTGRKQKITVRADVVVGAPLRGRTVIVDDVITDGASKRESVELLRREGAERSRPDRARPDGTRRRERTCPSGLPLKISSATTDAGDPGPTVRRPARDSSRRTQR
jgi:hypothetical protein